MLRHVLPIEVNDVDPDGATSSEQQSQEDKTGLACVEPVLFAEDDWNRFEQKVHDAVAA